MGRFLAVCVALCLVTIESPSPARAAAFGKGFVAGVGVGYGGVLERGLSRWVYHAGLRLGWIIAPQFVLVLENQFFVNAPRTGPNAARMFTVLHAPMVMARIVSRLYFKGGLGFAYLFERGTQNRRRYGFAGIVGLGFHAVQLRHFALSTEFQVVPLLMGSNGHYLLQAGLVFHFN